MSLAAGTRLGPYEILAPIGAGGMGEVYRARDARLNREVALKVLPAVFMGDADRMARFRREAQVLASLNHSHIALLYGLEQDALVMELVEGPTLADRLARGALVLQEALAIARQIAEALEYAHERGVIHRDLKPANIKVTIEGRVKLLDFGLAKALAPDVQPDADTATSPTKTISSSMPGMLMGTAGYMSPEQARGMPADKRADIWAFGVVLYEMLAGRSAFSGETISDTLASVLKTDPEWNALPPETPVAIRRLLRRCLDRDRKRRLRDIGDALIEIDDALAAQLESAPAIVSSGGARRAWIAASILLAAGLIALSAIHFREVPTAAVIRFQIPAPRVSNIRGAIAVSPDGRRLVYSAVGPGGQIMLWLRHLDSLDARPLAGTEGASRPFWSPDGRYLAFFTAEALKKIEISGGPPQTLCQVSSNRGGSWSATGAILLQSRGRALARVSQDGGEPVTVTSAPSDTAEWHGYPQFLPDGRHFIYLAASGELEGVIWIGSLDGKERKRLLNTQSSAAYLGPARGEKKAHLLFLRENILIAQPLDPGTYELAGDPVPVASNVASAGSDALFSVSPQGILAYRSGSNTSLENSLMWFDRTGEPLGTLGPPARYSNLALAPDGTRAAAGRGDERNGTTDVWMLDVRLGVARRFTFDRGVTRAPIWSPDGSRVVFVSNREGAQNLYWKDSSGGGADQVLLKSNGAPEGTDWSSDGHYLLYWVHSAKTGYDLWVMREPAGDPARRPPAPYLESPSDETQGQFAPAGAEPPRWVAYTSNESGEYEIYVQSFPAGSGKYLISTAGGVQPRWRRDGKELFYLAANGKLMAVDVTTGPRFSNGAPRALFDPHLATGGVPQFPFRYDVTADGKRFLVISNLKQNEPESSPITVVVNWAAVLTR